MSRTRGADGPRLRLLQQCLPGTMRITSFIGDQDIVKTIPKHLGRWLIRSKPPEKAHAPPVREYATDSFCRSASSDHTARCDPDCMGCLHGDIKSGCSGANCPIFSEKPAGFAGSLKSESPLQIR